MQLTLDFSTFKTLRVILNSSDYSEIGLWLKMLVFSFTFPCSPVIIEWSLKKNPSRKKMWTHLPNLPNVKERLYSPQASLQHPLVSVESD